jgi:hypothetical protein
MITLQVPAEYETTVVDDLLQVGSDFDWAQSEHKVNNFTFTVDFRLSCPWL